MNITKGHNTVWHYLTLFYVEHNINLKTASCHGYLM